MCSDRVIEVSGLSKAYPTYAQPHHRMLEAIFRSKQRTKKVFHALRNISFEIRRGETVGIIGRNGSGKSTLLQIICGTLQPSQGSVQVRGRVAALLELGAGFNPEFTGLENVYLNAAILGLNRRQIDERLEAILAFADIGDFIHQAVKTYSSGMFVRLAFAVVAHVDADILVIDEALAVGDAFFTQKCMRFLRKFKEKGTILFVSHDNGAVVNLCDRVIWLNQGAVELEGDAKAVCERYLAAYYNQPVGEEEAGVANRKQGSDSVVTDEQQRPSYDQRRDWINTSSYRNDLEVFNFNPHAEYFGTGAARVSQVQLLDVTGRVLSWVVGGELVELRVEVTSNIDLLQPIVGFVFKDRLGQPLFGDNTFITTQVDPVAIAAGETIVANFRFQMPILPPGDYALCAAIANGSQDNHVVHQWIHDAVIVSSRSSSITTGLVGVPMQEIKLQRVGAAAFRSSVARPDIL